MVFKTWYSTDSLKYWHNTTLLNFLQKKNFELFNNRICVKFIKDFRNERRSGTTLDLSRPIDTNIISSRYISFELRVSGVERPPLHDRWHWCATKLHFDRIVIRPETRIFKSFNGDFYVYLINESVH